MTRNIKRAMDTGIYHQGFFSESDPKRMNSVCMRGATGKHFE